MALRAWEERENGQIANPNAEQDGVAFLYRTILLVGTYGRLVVRGRVGGTVVADPQQAA